MRERPNSIADKVTHLWNMEYVSIVFYKKQNIRTCTPTRARADVTDAPRFRKHIKSMVGLLLVF